MADEWEMEVDLEIFNKAESKSHQGKFYIYLLQNKDYAVTPMMYGNGFYNSELAIEIDENAVFVKDNPVYE